MSGELEKFDDAGATFERDLKVADMLFAGYPIGKVALQENCSVREIETALVRITGAASPAIRERAFRTLYGRMERINRAHYVNALKGNYDATICCIRANDFIARMLGLYAPVQTQSPLEEARPIETSTDKIRAAIDFVCGKTDRTIDGEAVETPEKPESDSDG